MKHHNDLVSCQKLNGNSIGKLCDRCDGKCVICDSYVRPTTLVRICDECDFNDGNKRCIICNNKGNNDAYYCKTCVILEKDREGCPKIINLGMSRKDFIFDKRNNTINKNMINYCFVFVNLNYLQILIDFVFSSHFSS